MGAPTTTFPCKHVGQRTTRAQTRQRTVTRNMRLHRTRLFLTSGPLLDQCPMVASCRHAATVQCPRDRVIVTRLPVALLMYVSLNRITPSAITSEWCFYT